MRAASRFRRPLVVIRELTPADLDAVVAIEHRVNPQPWSRTLFSQELDLPPANRHWLVAVELDGGRDGQVDGTADESPDGQVDGTGDGTPDGQVDGTGDESPDGQVVGFGGMMYAPDAAHLMLLGVEPSRARRGIGARLCAALFLEARRRGATDVTLEVRAGNRPAIRLYERLGMTPTGTRPAYYPDDEDATIFWLHDLQSATVGDRLDLLAGEREDNR